MSSKITFFSIIVLTVFIGVIGCKMEPQDADFDFNNQPPETILAPTPVDSSMNNPFRIRLQWHGNDIDGRVVAYQYRLKGPLFDDDNTETWYKIESFFEDFKLRDGWYTLYIKAVDDKGAVDETPDSLHFHVKGPTFDKGILLVDNDYLEDDDCDSEKDAMYDNLMIEAGFPEYTHWDYKSKFGILEAPVFTGKGVDLNGETYDGLSAFSSILWYTGGIPHADSASSKSINLKNEKTLIDYLDMGGNLWIAGMQPMFNIIGEQPDGSLFPESNFLRKYLKIRNALLAEMEIDKLISAQYPEYPDLLTTYTNPRNPNIKGYMITSFADGDTILFCANQVVPEPCADVLYIFSDNVRVENIQNTDHFINSEEFANAPCAIRYRGNYNVIVFGFPLVLSYKNWKRINVLDEETIIAIFRHVLADEFGEKPQ